MARRAIGMLSVLALLLIFLQVVQASEAQPGFSVLYSRYDKFYARDNWAIIVTGDKLNIYSPVGNYSLNAIFGSNAKYMFAPSTRLVIGYKPGSIASLPKIGVASVNGVIVKKFGSVSSFYLMHGNIYYTTSKYYPKRQWFLTVLPGNETLNLTMIARKAGENVGFRVIPSLDGGHVCLYGLGSKVTLLVDLESGRDKDYGRVSDLHFIMPYTDGCIIIPSTESKGESKIVYAGWSRTGMYTIMGYGNNSTVYIYANLIRREGNYLVIPYKIIPKGDATISINVTLGVLVWDPLDGKTLEYTIPGSEDVSQFYDSKYTNPVAIGDWGIALSIHRYKHSKPDENSPITDAWSEIRLVSFKGTEHTVRLTLAHTTSLLWINGKLFFSLLNKDTGIRATGIIDPQTGKITEKASIGGFRLIPITTSGETVIAALPVGYAKITVFNDRLRTLYQSPTKLTVEKFAVIGDSIIASAWLKSNEVIILFNPLKAIGTTTSTKTGTSPTVSTSHTKSTVTYTQPTTTHKTTTIHITTSQAKTQSSETSKTSSSPASNNNLGPAVIVGLLIIIAIGIAAIKTRK